MSKNILELNNINAKKFFLTQEAFSNIELPSYFSFQDVLYTINKSFKKKILDESDLKDANTVYLSTFYVLYSQKILK